ncbi:hypothetical protein LTR86_003276 [Recurvomyces mirabilis]|nr:hypothetical protein LTR86_003276 [Recurvomyces mirabilis]
MESSSLIQLSPELRNQIYAFVFNTPYAVTLQPGLTQHPLTKTCRQLRRETLKMYYSLTCFNAHLDDGPATPLAKWLSDLGREKCLLLREVNVWDMHMLNATLHGRESTEAMSRHGTVLDGVRKQYVLHPPGSWLMNQGWYLKDIVVALHAMDLELLNLAIRNLDDYGLESSPSMTSHFAVVTKAAVQPDIAGGRTSTDPFQTGLSSLLSRLGFDTDMVEEIIMKLQSAHPDRWNCQEIRIRRGRRDIFLYFDSGRFRLIRQTFVPRG